MTGETHALDSTNHHCLFDLFELRGARAAASLGDCLYWLADLTVLDDDHRLGAFDGWCPLPGTLGRTS